MRGRRAGRKELELGEITTPTSEGWKQKTVVCVV